MISYFGTISVSIVVPPFIGGGYPIPALAGIARNDTARLDVSSHNSAASGAPEAALFGKACAA